MPTTFGLPSLPTWGSSTVPPPRPPFAWPFGGDIQQNQGGMPQAPTMPKMPTPPQVGPPQQAQSPLDQAFGAYGMGGMAIDKALQPLWSSLPSFPQMPSFSSPQAGPTGQQGGTSSSPAPTQQPASAEATGDGSDYRAMASSAAQKYGIDPAIFLKQINQESGFNPTAVSPAGARGIAQFMESTAQGMGIDPMNPEQALDGAARLMASYVKQYGSMVNALIAYNAGSGTLQAYLAGKQDLPDETKRYLQDILGS